MRLEATIPDPRAAQLAELAKELKVSKSTLIEEALSLLFTGLVEARHGRRFAIIEAESQRIVSQVATPLLSQIEWTAHREQVSLSAEGQAKLEQTVARPPKPTAALRRAMTQRQRQPVQSTGAVARDRHRADR